MSWLEAKANKTLREIIDDPDIGRADKFIALSLSNAGYSDDYVPGFNVLMNGSFVLNALKISNMHDFIWLCNQIGATMSDYNRRGERCIDNYRLSHVQLFTNTYDAHYKCARAQGCCGFHDELLKNPLTGNSFWFGFNYGH